MDKFIIICKRIVWACFTLFVLFITLGALLSLISGLITH